MSSQLFCEIIDHNNQEIIGFCLSEQCKERLQYCSQCFSELHQDHQNKCFTHMQLNEIGQQQTNFLVQLQLKIQEKQQQIQKSFGQFTKLINDIEMKIKEIQIFYNDQNYKEIKELKIMLVHYFQNNNNSILNVVNSLFNEIDLLASFLEEQTQIANEQHNKLTQEEVQINLNKTTEINNLSNQAQIENINTVEIVELNLNNNITNQYQEVLECYEQAIKIDPNYIKAYIGQVLQQLHKYENALESYEQALKINPNCAQALYNKGLSFQALEQHLDANECFDQLLKIDPNCSNAYYYKGISFEAQQLYQEAGQCYDQAIYIDPNFTNAYINKGNILNHQKKYQEAILSINKAVQLNPNLVNIFNDKEKILKKPQQQFGQSQKQYHGLNNKCYQQQLNLETSQSIDRKGKQHDNILNISFNLIQAYYNKGIEFQLSQKYAEALQCYEKLLKIDPNYVIAYNNKGNILYNQKKYQQAVQCFDKAIQIDPLYVKAYYNKGITIQAQHNQNKLSSVKSSKQNKNLYSTQQKTQPRQFQQQQNNKPNIIYLSKKI